MNRRLFLLVVVLLACLVLPAGLVAAEGEAPAAETAAPTYSSDGEPNDSFTSATPLWIPMYWTDGYFSHAADVDYYRLDLKAAYNLDLDVHQSYAGEAVEVRVSVYNSDHALVDEDIDCNYGLDLDLVVPAGTYYVRTAPCAGALYPDAAYRLYYGLQQTGLEPNNTRTTANPLSDVCAWHYCVISETIQPVGDVDFYSFLGASQQKLDLKVYGDDNFLSPQISLLSSNGTVLSNGEIECAWHTACLTYTLPTAGTYYLRIRSAGSPLTTGTYSFDYGSPVDPNEPNDTRETATPAVYGQIIRGYHDGISPDGGNQYDCAGDDWYGFQGRAGDVLDFIDPPGGFAESPVAWLYDGNGNRLYGQSVLPTDGVYYLRVLTDSWTDDDYYCMDDAYSFVLGQSLWVSAPVDGLGGNPAIKRGDIVTRKTAAGQWAIVFDASDVGITADVTAIERMPNGTILMSLGAAQTVPGLGKVMPQDVIRFIPSSLGDATAGFFEWFLDGSDVGLTTTGEKIDALYMNPESASPLHISIIGAGSVPRQSGGALTVQDEDVINLVQTAFGPNSAGKWRMILDGSTVPGMAAEDINALDRIDVYPARLSPHLMTLFDSFNINGVTGGPRDVFGLEKGIWVRNLTNVRIDALAVGPAWTP